MSFFSLFGKKARKEKDDILMRQAAARRKDWPSEKKTDPLTTTSEGVAKGIEKTAVLFGVIDVFVGDEKKGRFQITDQPVRIGRDPSRVEVVISEPIVSKWHCTIFVKENTVWIKDNQSTNGTFVNDRNVQELILKDGDVISVGKKGVVRIIFHKGGIS